MSDKDNGNNKLSAVCRPWNTLQACSCSCHSHIEAISRYCGVNIIVDASLEPGEWYIVTGTKRGVYDTPL